MVKVKLILSLCFVILFFSCKKDEVIWQVQNLNLNNKTFAFGHGGMGIMYRFPMNSIQSLTEVLKKGADGTEMDLQLTKDNQLVLFHSIRLEDASNGNGLVRNKNWEDIKNVDYTYPLFTKTKLISIEDFFNQIKVDGHIFTFDCKVESKEDPDYLQNFASTLYNFIKKYELENNCFIESYNLTFLQALSAQNKNLKLFIHSDTYAAGLVVSKEVNLYGMTLDRLKITKEEIAEAHQQGLHITLYNMVNASENLKAIQMNADFLQTDKIEQLIEIVSK